MATFDPTYLSRVSIGWFSSTESIVDQNPGDTGPSFSVTADARFFGDTRVSTLTASGAATIDGAVRLNSTLTVSGAATLTGTLRNTGAATLTSTLSVGGALTQDGAATLRSTLSALGTATFTGGFRSPSNVTLTSDVSIGGGLNVDSNVTLRSDLSVAGALTANGAGLLTSTLSVGGNLTATGGILVGNAVAAQEITFMSNATAALSFGAINPLESSSVITFALSGATRGDLLLLTPDSLWPVTAANRDISYFASSSSTEGEVHAWAINSTLTAVTPTASTVFRALRISFANYI